MELVPLLQVVHCRMQVVAVADLMAVVQQQEAPAEPVAGAEV
jgi:hypothetical protein